MTDDRIGEIWRLPENYCKPLAFGRAIEAECRVPEGYVPVPVEPSDSQLYVAVSFALNVKLCNDYNWSAYMRDVYARMIAAAPKPAEPEGREHLPDGYGLIHEPVAQEPVAFMNSQGKPVSADWIKHHARECEQDEYTTPLYLAPTDQSAEAQREINMALDLDDARERIAELEQIIEDQRTLYRNATAIANELDQVKRQRDELVAALEEARDQVVSWAAYASEYFQQKHNLAGYVAKLDAVLASVKGNA